MKIRLGYDEGKGEITDMTDAEWQEMFKTAQWKNQRVHRCAFVNADGGLVSKTYLELPHSGP
jgi:hypothetical protein